mgnify:CR=1 FL=1
MAALVARQQAAPRPHLGAQLAVRQVAWAVPLAVPPTAAVVAVPPTAAVVAGLAAAAGLVAAAGLAAAA